MVSLAKKRIEDVFKESFNSVRSGKQPNISRAMIKHGYSLASARSQKVVRTRTWELLKAKYLKDDKAVMTLDDLVDKKNTDKDNRLKASIEILKLNDRYPKPETKIISLFTKIGELEGRDDDNNDDDNNNNNNDDDDDDKGGS